MDSRDEQCAYPYGLLDGEIPRSRQRAGNGLSVLSDCLARKPTDIARGVIGLGEGVGPTFPILPYDQPCEVFDIIEEQTVEGGEDVLTFLRGEGAVVLECCVGSVYGPFGILDCHFWASTNDLACGRI